jgi:hypothetical protein
MRRTFSIAVVVLLPAAALAVMTLVIYQPGLSADGQQALDQYLHYQGLDASSRWVQQMRHATRPRAFTASMGAATFGSGTYFQVLHSYQPSATVSSFIWDKPIITSSLGVVSAQSTGQVPLPYPPEDLWCVLMNPAAAAPKSVFLAQHGDIFVDAWVVHELPPNLSRDALADDWAKVGCAVDWAP